MDADAQIYQMNRRERSMLKNLYLIITHYCLDPFMWLKFTAKKKMMHEVWSDEIIREMHNADLEIILVLALSKKKSKIN